MLRQRVNTYLYTVLHYVALSELSVAHVLCRFFICVLFLVYIVSIMFVKCNMLIQKKNAFEVFIDDK